MPATRPKYVNQLLEMWSKLLWTQRITICLCGLLGVALIATIVYFMNRVSYETLYRDLDPEDAQAIARKLKDEKKDFQVQGTSILVAAPKNEIDKLRLEIAGEGLGRSGRVGYEIFDKNQFGMTDFTEQVNLQRALEGELARTISSLSEISQARVHIVLPKDSVFQENKEDAKASVVLRLKKGAELSKASVAGIKGVVAGAVPGLHTYNVSIVDDDGRLLSQSVESGDAARNEMESGFREQLEKEMAGKVVSILEPVVGKNKVHANASIDVDFNTTEQTEETFNPNPPVILSQQRSEERAGGSMNASGIPGTQSNMQVPGSQGATYSPERTRHSETTNYEVNKLVRHTIQPKGTVQRLSVAVILDNKTIYTKGKNGKIIETTEARSPKDLESYRQLVLAAVGYDEERGDVVTIENVPFYTQSRPEEERPPVTWHVKAQPYIFPAMKYVAFLLLFFIVYLLLFRPIRKHVFQTFHVAAVGPGQETAVQLPAGAMESALPGGAQTGEITAGAAAGSLPAGTPEVAEEEIISQEALDEQVERELMKEASMADAGNRKYAALKRKLADKAKKDPELVSQLLRSWLKDRG
jgi:flagellar M-ring protein FliF